MRYVTLSDFTRINSDSNGNPRYVCHFLRLLTPSERDSYATEKYTLALARAKKIGGKKFHNRQYGGGIAFQVYSMEETCNSIDAMIELAVANEVTV